MRVKKVYGASTWHAWLFLVALIGLIILREFLDRAKMCESHLEICFSRNAGFRFPWKKSSRWRCSSSWDSCIIISGSMSCIITCVRISKCWVSISRWCSILREKEFSFGNNQNEPMLQHCCSSVYDYLGTHVIYNNMCPHFEMRHTCT
jgi:hypothetical protein